MTPGVNWRRRHLLRRRLSDVLDHADALQRDIEELLEEHELHPHRASVLHEVMRLRAEQTELDRVTRTFARERDLDPNLPTPELRRRLRAVAERRRTADAGYAGPERRVSPRRAHHRD